MDKRSATCHIEATLGREASLELDIMLADPKRWPKAIFEGWQLPPGPMPMSMRSWGGIKVGLEWCRSRGFEFTSSQMNRHYREHVPIVPYTPDDFVAKGAETAKTGLPAVPDDPITYMQVYQNGLRVGNRALDLLQRRVDELIADDKDVPTQLLLKLADLGTKLATSQASIMARGMDLSRQQDDEIEGFRAGSAPLPSERLGHHRIRVIEGEPRPVADQGPADRAKYNERAKQEGSPTLPSP